MRCPLGMRTRLGVCWLRFFMFRCHSLRRLGLGYSAESGRVVGAVDFALEYLERGAGVYNVEFACTHEISGALAGTFLYSIVNLENGDRIHATVYQKTATGLHHAGLPRLGSSQRN